MNSLETGFSEHSAEVSKINKAKWQYSELYMIRLIIIKGQLRGGYQAYFFGNINFEIAVAQQGPYMYQHFGEVSGPWRPTGSEPRPALIWAPGIAIWLFWF